LGIFGGGEVVIWPLKAEARDADPQEIIGLVKNFTRSRDVRIEIASHPYRL
jgi:hypothetical protein